MSVATEMLPGLGASIVIEVDLPRSHREDRPRLELSQSMAENYGQGSYLLLTAEGVVLRHHANGLGFAAAISHASVDHQSAGHRGMDHQSAAYQMEGKFE